MILAVQAFNNPGLGFKSEVFAVLANIAWTYLLHEYYLRKNVDIVGKDGHTLLLSQMLKRQDCPLSQGIKNNLADIKEIRDSVEHLLLRRGDAKFFSRFQACCLNFEKTICALFGERLSLSNELSLALQFAKIDFEQITTIEKYDIPEEIAALDARLSGPHSEEELADLEYQFRVVYTFQSAAKSRAHIQFVRPDTAEGKEICNVLEKRVVADTLYPYKPTDVCSLVTKKTGIRFTTNSHLKAAYLYNVRPKTGAKHPDNTDKEFCIYHPLYKSYSYSDAWVARLCSAVTDKNELSKLK